MIVNRTWSNSEDDYFVLLFRLIWFDLIQLLVALVNDACNLTIHVQCIFSRVSFVCMLETGNKKAHIYTHATEDIMEYKILTERIKIINARNWSEPMKKTTKRNCHKKKFRLEYGTHSHIVNGGTYFYYTHRASKCVQHFFASSSRSCDYWFHMSTYLFDSFLHSFYVFYTRNV